MSAKGKLSRGKKIIIAFAAFCGLTGAGLLIARSLIQKSNTDNTTYTVKKEVYENVIDIAGVVSAAQEQTLQALSSGTVKAVYVKQGDSVKKGDVILQLDDTDAQYNLAKHDYEMQTTWINGSQKAYELMKVERAALLQKIAERQVTATFDGIIADIDVAVGDSLEAKDQVGKLVNVSYLLAKVEVAETDVSKLEKNQTVEFTFPAYSGTVTGYVVNWPALGEVTNRGATVVNVTVRIDDYPEEILPNFSFSGKIKVSPDETYLLVSRNAIARENGQAYVELAQSGERRNVTVSPYDSSYVKIESGLEGGEVLKAQSSSQVSGTSRRGGSGNNRNMGNMGPGAGGPPPGF